MLDDLFRCFVENNLITVMQSPGTDILLVYIFIKIILYFYIRLTE